jgi:uncharacterized protein (UPF0335 family)
MTSLQILLCCIRDTWVARKNPYHEFKGHRQLRTARTQELIFNTGNNPGFRFVSNYYLMNLFRDYVQLETDHPDRKHFATNRITDPTLAVRAKKLIDAYNYFKQKIGELKDDDRLAELENHIIESVQVLRIKAASVSDAYVLFETLNDRGLELAPSDLVKTFLLSQLSENDSQIDQAAQQWDDMSGTLKAADTTNFLRHYLLMDTPKVKKKDIFQGFKSRIRTGNQNARQALEDLMQMANLYAMITRVERYDKSDDIDEVFESLDSVGVDTHRVFLLAVLKKFDFMSADKDKVFYACQIAEILSFRWTICGLNAQTLETIYQKAASAILSSASDAFEKSIDTLKKAMPSDRDFESNFALHEVRNSRVAGYALRRIEMHLNPSLVHNLKSRQKLHVEHIAPKKPNVSSNWRTNLKGNEPYDDIICRWGNLTLLPAPLNSSIRNGEFSAKLREGYLPEKKLHLTKSLHGLKTWRFSNIEERSKELSKIAVEVWNLNSVRNKTSKSTARSKKRSKRTKKQASKSKRTKRNTK